LDNRIPEKAVVKKKPHHINAFEMVKETKSASKFA
jgi:hypothetical protein